MTLEEEQMRRIEALRSTLHRQMGGHYDPVRVAQLVPISQELDKLVVEVTRSRWAGGSASLPHAESGGAEQSHRQRRVPKR